MGVNVRTNKQLKVLLYSFITLICQKRIPTLEVFDVKVSKDILTEEAWGFIVTINSQTTTIIDIKWM